MHRRHLHSQPQLSRIMKCNMPWPHGHSYQMTRNMTSTKIHHLVISKTTTKLIPAALCTHYGHFGTWKAENRREIPPKTTKACNQFKGISSNSCRDICGKLWNIKERHPRITLHWEKTIEKWNQSIYRCKSIRHYRPALSAQEALSAEDKAERLEKHNRLLYHSITEGNDGKKKQYQKKGRRRDRGWISIW